MRGIKVGQTELRWSNFTMRPLFHIKDAINPKRLYELRNEAGSREIVELKQEDLVSLSKFRQRVEGLGNYIFEANEQCLVLDERGLRGIKVMSASSLSAIGSCVYSAMGFPSM